MTSTVISYPVPPYSNPPIEPQFYKPRFYYILDITRGLSTTITTTVDHDYVIGQEIRLIIPPKFGSRKLNEIRGYVISVPALNQVTVNIDSVGVDAFIPNPTFSPFQSQTLAQILAIGDINSGALNQFGRSPLLTYIPGSFQDISPI